MASFHCGSQLLPVEIDASSRTFHSNGNDTKYCECPNASVKLRWPSPQISHSRYPSEGSRAAHCFHRLLGGVALRHWVIAHHRADFSPRFPGGQEGKRYHFALIQRGSGASLVFERIERAMDFGKDVRCAVGSRHRLVRPCRSGTCRSRRKKSRTFQLHFVLLRLRLRFAIREHPKIS